MVENLGRCDKKQYEHCGPHPQYADVGQRLPPFGCVNWKPEPECSQRQSGESQEPIYHAYGGGTFGED